MKALVLIAALAIGGNALAITPLAAVALVVAGVVAAGLACAAIVGIVRLTGARPGRLLSRDAHAPAHVTRKDA